jgi:broad specificity phosphatase PhoE
MMRRRTFLVAVLCLLAWPAAAQPAAAPNIYVMRHLNTPEGQADPDLTPAGQATAAALPQWLAKDPPAVIYVSDYKRTRQTAAPTAERYHVTLKVYDPRDTPALVKAVLAEKGTVLVVGHSNTVPDIIAALGGERPAPLVHEDFGDIWHIAGEHRTTTRAKLPAQP